MDKKKNIWARPAHKWGPLVYLEVFGEQFKTEISRFAGTYARNTYIDLYITVLQDIDVSKSMWYLDTFINKPRQSEKAFYGDKQEVIILTTDPDLIDCGVKAIDDEFLSWYIDNPCEWVDVVKISSLDGFDWFISKEITQYKMKYSEEQVRDMLNDMSRYISTPELMALIDVKYNDWTRKRDWFINHLIEKSHEEK